MMRRWGWGDEEMGRGDEEMGRDGARGDGAGEEMGHGDGATEMRRGDGARR